MAPASAAELSLERPYLRGGLYMRTAFGTSLIRVRSSSPESVHRSTSPYGLTMDVMLGVGIRPHTAIGFAFNAATGGASVNENGVSRTARATLVVPGVFVHFYPAPDTVGWYIGTTLGWGWGYGTGEATANGPALVATTGFEVRGEQGRSMTFGFRLAHSPFLRNDDVRMTATSFGFFLALGIR